MKKLLSTIMCLSIFLIYSCATAKKSTNAAVKNLTQKDLREKEFALENMYKELEINIGFENNRIYGFSGVNRYMSDYKLNGDKITISGAASTMMAGPEKNMNAEIEYLKLLNEADTIMLDGDILTIKTKSGQVLIYKQIK